MLIVGGIAVVGMLQARGVSPSPQTSRVPLYLSVVALQLLFLWFINKGIRPYGRSLFDLAGRRWRSLKDGGTDLFLAIGLVVALRGINWLLRFAFGPAQAKIRFLLPQSGAEMLLWIVVAVVAGVSEEIVYRGYLQRQRWSITRSLPVAVLTQALIFALAHMYQGWRAAALTVVYGLAFGALAAWRRSIMPSAIAHVVIDIIGALTAR
ncbi:MAG: CPBP family intramembrane metalloprotease [Verrucomicrobiota bacterium]|nr:CPBP family intramembrane metalloprotease [Verrucomicrobiota bacterium]